ncbi:MAG: hypothetical protein JXR42_01065 [Gammaproteobacteria bacterium]|nr:hypothetical protein [Gammaproteobacteria bacterium]
MISLLLPTRGRPELVLRFFKSVVDTSSDLERVEIILYVDDDDDDSHHLDSDVLQVKRIIGPRTTMGNYNTRCLEESAGDIIVLVNDDMVIRTQGWDDKLRELNNRYDDGVYLGYGNDLFKGGDLCTFPILSRKTCDILVEPYPSTYKGAFIDYHLLDVFKRLQHAGYDRICYLEDVVFEHLHYRSGKAEIDATYTQRGRFADDQDFLDLIDCRKNAGQRLLGAIKKGELPEAKPCTPDENGPKGLFGLMSLITFQVLFDTKLPFRWRFFLWYWFIGRTLAAKGLLWPFVR